MTQPSGPNEPANDYAKLRAVEAVAYLHLVFGRTIRRLRDLHKISRPDLATSLGIPEAHLETIESGETSVPAQVRARLELIFGETL